MSSMFKKILYFGIGAISLTKEKADKLIDELVEKGEMSSEEAKQFVDEMIQKGSEEKAELSKMVNSEMEKVRNDFGFVKKADFEALEKRVIELEAKLEAKS